MKPVTKWKRFWVSSLVSVLVLQLVISGVPALPGLAGASGQTGSIVYADTKTTAQIIFDGTQSQWAEQTLIDAYEAGLTYPEVMKSYTKPITREEFATVAVKLYEKLSGKILQAGTSPFGDTSNPEVIKANQLGIVLGTGPGVFSPNANIKRQEMAAMIMRALSVSVPNLPKPSADALPFSDKGNVASWALESVKFAYQNKIINGMGNNQIAPLANTTREQAIAIIKRAYDSFSGGTNIKAIIPLGNSTPPIKNERTKFKTIDFNNRLTAPDYDTRLTLYAATDAAKPAKRGYASAQVASTLRPLLALNFQQINPNFDPELINTDFDLTDSNLELIDKGLLIDPDLLLPNAVRPVWWTAPRAAGSVYSKADCAAFVDWGKSKERYFSFSANNATGAANVVWQVSRTPFNGFPDNWSTPRGLVAKGTVPISAGEFVIDFATFAPMAPGSGTFYKLTPNAVVLNAMGITGNTYREIPKTQYKYYVRAVPVTAAGIPVGDPGEGIEVLYGKPVATSHESKVSTSLDLWTAIRSGPPTSGKEFPNLIEDRPVAGVSPISSDQWFQLRTPAATTTRVVMQVALTEFTDSTKDWETPEKLVYSKSYSMPLETVSIYPNLVNILFSSFGPPASSLADDEFVDFYVRAVTISPSNTPGLEEIGFSEPVHIEYGTPAAPIIYRNESVTIPSYTPSIRIAHYEPIQFENPDWAHHYIVFRAPKWNEIGSFYKNENGSILAPYLMYTMSLSPYYDKTMTVDKYENQLIPQFLTENTMVYIPPPVEEDKSWWEELWDGIVSFFEDLISVVKNLTNWVANAYNGLKAGLIDFVASNFPLIPDEWRAGLKTALEALVNTGLAAMGLPPSLPNFDQLTDLSLNYMANVALTQAGIPANAITDELLDKTMDGIKDGIETAANAPTPNPINAPFLKNDPAYLYRPAYIDVELSNIFDKPSLPGTFSIDAEWEWTENVSLDFNAWANQSTAQQYADAMDYTTHFIYGLSRGHKGYPIYYTLFEPIRSQPIPILQPGEKTTVRIYLKEYIGKPYSFTVGGDSVYPEDFAQMYWGTTGTTNVYSGGQSVSQGYDTTFKVYVDSNFNLPPAAAAAKAMGKTGTDPNCIYTYNYQYGNAVETFEQIAAEPYK